MEPNAQFSAEQIKHRAHVGVECPQCHFRQFMEVDFERPEELKSSPLAAEIRAHLEAWMASRCPDHLGIISQLSKN